MKFVVTAPAAIEAVECNCSICTKSGFLHLIVPNSRFSLLQGKESLAVYTFNTGTAKHLFCVVCGIKSFYIPRSHPDATSVNVRCLEPESVKQISVTHFDGEHWEQSAGALSPLTD